MAVKRQQLKLTTWTFTKQMSHSWPENCLTVFRPLKQKFFLLMKLHYPWSDTVLFLKPALVSEHWHRHWQNGYAPNGNLWQIHTVTFLLNCHLARLLSSCVKRRGAGGLPSTPGSLQRVPWNSKGNLCPASNLCLCLSLQNWNIW